MKHHSGGPLKPTSLTTMKNAIIKGWATSLSLHRSWILLPTALSAAASGSAGCSVFITGRLRDGRTGFGTERAPNVTSLAFVAHSEATMIIEPRERCFDDPPYPAKAASVVNTAPSARSGYGTCHRRHPATMDPTIAVP